jgi:hypothetical protein
LQTFLVLLTGHLVGDFVLQTRGLVAAKGRWPWLLLHVALVTGATALLLGSAAPAVLGILFATHLAMDAVKVHRLGDGLRPFLLDQAFHLAVIGFLAYWFPETLAEGFWFSVFGPEPQRWYLILLTGIAGLVLCVPAAGIVIGFLMRPYLDELRATPPSRTLLSGVFRPRRGPDDFSGLKDGGRVIGWLERGLVFLLVLIDMPGGIGFLAAAKSILRFRDIQDSGQWKLTEYIIIGTLLSFTWALLSASATQRAMAFW